MLVRMLRYFKKRPAVLRAFGRSTNSNGVWTAGEATDTDILVVELQPAAGAELLWMPEGDRKFEHFYTWTEYSAVIHDSTERADPDQIIIDSFAHLVVKAENWLDGGFREILMRRLPGVAV